MDLEGQPVVVVGLARSGVAAARFLARRGARVVATDRKAAGELPEEVLRLQEQGVRLELGGHHAESLRAASLVVVSPGVPWDLPELVSARGVGIPVMAEIELAFRCLQGTVAAVTGTKGKSTTTAALGAMLREDGRDTRVGGNIGAPLIGFVEGSNRQTVFVVEVSSFQLEGAQTFRPDVGAHLNLSPDHLDRHPSFEAYAEAKARLFVNQTPPDWAVVNADDPATLAAARRGRARIVLFHPAVVRTDPVRTEPARTQPGGTPQDGKEAVPAANDRLADEAFFSDGQAFLRRDGDVETLFPLAAVRLPGAHLAGDLLVAATMARLLGVGPPAIARAVEGFQGVEHVLERVAEIRGVTFFNDSKATNVDAAFKSLTSFERPVVAILGGRYKGGDFGRLQEAARGRVKAVMAIGEASTRVQEALSPVAPVTACESLEQAVSRAFAAAAPGDVVLLAPASSSFDMFRDYAERGRAFKSEVRRLGAAEASAPDPGGPRG